MKQQRRLSAPLLFHKGRCHAEPVEAWWVGLCARSFDGLRMTALPLLLKPFKIKS